MSSLSDQIGELEDELEHYQLENSKLKDELRDIRDYVNDLEWDLEEANTFIAYVDKTSPELRTAFEASKVLEGEK